MTAAHTNSPRIGLREAFDRVHDGEAEIIDPNLCALALFVQHDGKVQVRSPHSAGEVAAMLRQLADLLDKR